ncbi:MAG: hypothetical protein NDI61_05145 [Bdellovibrionaceae bacterium]|nr:hypothetical protein [Pseudobdellovibrionaceae bacterium]
MSWVQGTNNHSVGCDPMIQGPESRHEHGSSVTPQMLKDPPAIHGMLLFGSGPFYVSHLPKFHKPHNYQAIYEIELDAATAAKVRSEKAKHGYFTIAPTENFVLPEMTKNKSTFPALLFGGHFERDGNKLGSAQIQIKRVVYFRQLNGENAASSESAFFAFGSRTEAFLARRIQKAPDFDQISKIQSPPLQLLDQLASQKIIPISTSDAKPITKDASISFDPQSPRTKNVFQATPIYTEFGDLSQ